MTITNASHMENARMLKRLLNNYGNVNIYWQRNRIRSLKVNMLLEVWVDRADRVLVGSNKTYQRL
jgi:hypothetical protein